MNRIRILLSKYNQFPEHELQLMGFIVTHVRTNHSDVNISLPDGVLVWHFSNSSKLKKVKK